MADPLSTTTAVDIGLIAVVAGAAIAVIRLAWSSLAELRQMRNQQAVMIDYLGKAMTRDEHKVWSLELRLSNPHMVVPQTPDRPDTPFPRFADEG